jgi:two-component system sensor histidine kinase YesM
MYRGRAIPRSVRSQVVILLLVFIIFPTTIISTFTLSKFTKIIKDNTAAAMKTALEHSKQNTAQFMKDVEDTALVIMTNEIIVSNILKKNPETSISEKLDAAAMLDQYLFELKMYNFRAEEIAVINKYGEKLFAGKNTIHQEDFTDPTWYDEIDKLDGKPYWGRFEKNGKYIYVARKIREYIHSLGRFERIGTVVITFSEKEFSRINESVKLLNGSKLMIADANGVVVSSSDKSAVGKRLSSEGNLTIDERIPNSDWNIVMAVPLDEILSVDRNIKVFILLVTSVSVIVAFFLAVLFAYKITIPLKRLVKEVKNRINSGDFSFTSTPIRHRQDEIAELGQGFYRLLSEFNDIKNAMHKVEMMKKEAELEALKSKINPHFLYNSLESVRMLAVVNKDPGTAEMIKSLGDIFRYISSGQNDVIGLAEELVYLQNYINLQKLRYEDRIRFEFDIPEQLLDTKLMKLVLQPVVENSIGHGIDRKRGSGLVKISAKEHEHGVLLEVWDNGAGIESDRLNMIRKSMDDPDDGANRIGLRNVYQRLRMRFGEPYGLSLDSRPGEYTSVFILVPR